MSHWCKIGRLYLLLVLNYWARVKSNPQKKFIVSNSYQSGVTFFKEILELPKLVTWLYLQSSFFQLMKLLFLMSWTKTLTSQPFFNSFSINLTKLSSNFLELVLRRLKAVISRRPQVVNFVDMIKAVITLIETEQKNSKEL